MANRAIDTSILDDLQKKMVFLAGPRQVGKTTLAKSLIQTFKPESSEARSTTSHNRYYSWDSREDRQHILRAQWPAEPCLVVLDELHKYRPWKRWIKGEFDKHNDRIHFLVTGSARLDIYRKGGDSLQGRYHHYRLHPFSLRELAAHSGKAGITHFPEPGRTIPLPEPGQSAALQKHLEALFRFGGFPEPLFAQSDRTLRRWHKERIERFFREDVRDLESIRDLSMMELLSDMLISRVGSMLSINALREDLEVSHRAVSHWIDILEKLYFVFRITPFTHKKIRGLKKKPKIYAWDSSLVSDPGARFENLVALHLLKFCHWMEDRDGYKTSLHYLRSVDDHETDFLVCVDNQPWFAVEAKLSNMRVDSGLHYFRERLGIPHCYQITYDVAPGSSPNTQDYLDLSGVHVLSAARFLSALA